MRCILLHTMLITAFTNSFLYTMNKKEKHNSTLLPKTVLAIIEDRYHHRNLTTEPQITCDNNKVKNRGGLEESWKKVFWETTVIPILNRIDSNVILSINITQAHKDLKKFYKLQLQSKIIRQIVKGKITSPFKAQDTAQENNTICTRLKALFYGISLISTGVIGKIVWDNGGKALLQQSALSIFNTIKAQL